MIVDVHTHAPRFKQKPEQPSSGPRANRAPMRPDRPDPELITWDEYLDAMAFVDKAIAFNIAAPPPGSERLDGVPVSPAWLSAPAQRLNDQTAEFARAHPEKIVGFMSVHPHDSGALDEMDRAARELGLRGIKLGSNYQNFDPLGEEAFRVYQRAEELRLPIVFHQGTSPVRFADLDYAHPRHIDRVATRFPELRIVLAHMAHPWQADCIAVIRKHPHVWADISALHYRPWSYYTCLRLATEWSVLHKLLFGSDFPVATPRETAEAIPHVNDLLEGTKLPRVPVDELQKVVERDVLGVLGLA
ncbi:MAG: amidohydrolase family protein [Chloroflexi bacterium]|nr:amidohydrolase family protein [Chloroflexota bacterium]